jgi:hypothetical protein
MKKCIMLVVAMVVMTTVFAQNSTITIDKLDPFKELQVNGKIELFITNNPNSSQSMTIDANGNDPNQVKWWNTEGVLQIRFSPKSKEQPVIIRLNAHSLETIDVQVASVTIEGVWSGSLLTANLATGAKFTATIECKDLKVSMQTAAAAHISGEIDYANYDVRSKSTLDARELAAKSADVSATIFSESYIYGSERIVITATDGASVFYRGTPTILRKKFARGGYANPLGI